MKTIIAIVVLLLAIIGLTEIIKFLSVKFFSINPNKKIYLVVLIDCKSDNIEVQFRDIAVYLQYQKIKREAIYILLKNSSSEKVEICKRLCDEYGFLLIHKST